VASQAGFNLNSDVHEPRMHRSQVAFKKWRCRIVLVLKKTFRSGNASGTVEDDQTYYSEK